MDGYAADLVPALKGVDAEDILELPISKIVRACGCSRGAVAAGIHLRRHCECGLRMAEHNVHPPAAMSGVSLDGSLLPKAARILRGDVASVLVKAIETDTYNRRAEVVAT